MTKNAPVETLGLKIEAPSRAEDNLHSSLGLKPGDFCEGLNRKFCLRIIALATSIAFAATQLEITFLTGQAQVAAAAPSSLRPKAAGQTDVAKNIGGALDVSVDKKIAAAIENGEAKEIRWTGEKFVILKIKYVTDKAIAENKQLRHAVGEGEVIGELNNAQAANLSAALTAAGISFQGIALGIIPQDLQGNILTGKRGNAIVHAGGRIWLPHSLAVNLLDNPNDVTGNLLAEILKHERKHYNPRYSHDDDNSYGPLVERVEQRRDAVVVPGSPANSALWNINLAIVTPTAATTATPVAPQPAVPQPETVPPRSTVAMPPAVPSAILSLPTLDELLAEHRGAISETIRGQRRRIMAKIGAIASAPNITVEDLIRAVEGAGAYGNYHDRDNDYNNRAACVIALGLRGASASRAVGPLREVLTQETDLGMKGLIEETLGKIEHSPAGGETRNAYSALPRNGEEGKVSLRILGAMAMILLSAASLMGVGIRLAVRYGISPALGGILGGIMGIIIVSIELCLFHLLGRRIGEKFDMGKFEKISFSEPKTGLLTFDNSTQTEIIIKPGYLFDKIAASAAGIRDFCIGKDTAQFEDIDIEYKVSKDVYGVISTIYIDARKPWWQRLSENFAVPLGVMLIFGIAALSPNLIPSVGEIFNFEGGLLTVALVTAYFILHLMHRYVTPFIVGLHEYGHKKVGGEGASFVASDAGGITGAPDKNMISPVRRFFYMIAGPLTDTALLVLSSAVLLDRWAAFAGTTSGLGAVCVAVTVTLFAYIASHNAIGVTRNLLIPLFNRTESELDGYKAREDFSKLNTKERFVAVGGIAGFAAALAALTLGYFQVPLDMRAATHIFIVPIVFVTSFIAAGTEYLRATMDSRGAYRGSAARWGKAREDSSDRKPPRPPPYGLGARFTASGPGDLNEEVRRDIAGEEAGEAEKPAAIAPLLSDPADAAIIGTAP